MAILSEHGLYFFLNRSDKPKALPFQKKVAGEILPQIRKTGQYTTPTATPQTTPADRQAIKNKAHDIGNCFHFAGGAREEVYNRLRIALNLASISNIAPHQLDTAHAILDQLHREARAYAAFRCELDDMAQAAIIRQGRPYTPHVKKALGELGLMVGTNPDWHALSQMVKNQMVKMT